MNDGKAEWPLTPNGNNRTNVVFTSPRLERTLGRTYGVKRGLTEHFRHQPVMGNIIHLFNNYHLIVHQQNVNSYSTDNHIGLATGGYTQISHPTSLSQQCRPLATTHTCPPPTRTHLRWPATQYTHPSPHSDTKIEDGVDKPRNHARAPKARAKKSFR